MTEYRRPKRTPSQVSHLERLLQSYGQATGVAPNRLRRWLTMMVMIGALDRVQADPDQPLFLVKGGVAMELRLRHGARATRDLDMVFLGDPDQLLVALDTAFAEPYSLFSFERGPAESIGTTQSRRLDVKVAFNGRSWATVRLEISPPEGQAGNESEVLDAISIEDFGLTGPDKVRCLSIRYQLAQKLHACTEVFATGHENDRFRDLIDLLLLRALEPNLTGIRHACIDVFISRAKHACPPALKAPISWADPYARLASELEFAITDLGEAAALIAEFIAEIDDAVELTPVLPRPGQTWRRDDGIVMMDMHRCIGCRYCMAACPFGARSFNWQDPRPNIPKDANGNYPSNYPTRQKGVVEKCDFCAERYPFDKQLPACVEAAAKLAQGQGALTFGNLDDPRSAVSQILESQHSICRRPNLGTGPNVYYLL